MKVLAIVLVLALAATGLAVAENYPPIETLPPPPEPADNPSTPAKVALGEKLFWDGRLSGNGFMPCAGCHIPELGWGGGTPISIGYPGTTHWRNSQTVINSAYYNKFFWEGSASSLETQAKDAASGAVAGNGDGSMMEMRLRFVPEYISAFRDVFGTDWPHIGQAWMAVAAFSRTIVTDATKVPYDRYLAGDESAMSESALRGMDLFHGKAGCISCHNGALASDQGFYNTGVPTPAEFSSHPLYQITLRWEIYQKGVPEEVYHAAEDDLGLYHRTKRPEDIGKFRTPSLRELLWTGPYMHNGAFSTLAEVVDFYDAGGGDGQTADLVPLGLAAEDKADLVVFLEALSMDEPLVLPEPDVPETEGWEAFAP